MTEYDEKKRKCKSNSRGDTNQGCLQNPLALLRGDLSTEFTQAYKSR